MPQNVTTVTDDNFESEVLLASQQVLVHFHATWNGPSKTLIPTVDQFALDYAGKIKVCRLDADASTVTMQRYGVMTIPTCMAFPGGRQDRRRDRRRRQRQAAETLPALSGHSARPHSPTPSHGPRIGRVAVDAAVTGC